jgi:putative NADH-flavin reductase
MELNKIAVLGGSGRTGKLFIKQALSKYKIKALVRSTAKLKMNDDNLEVIEGDALNAQDIEILVKGTQAVVSLIGHTDDSPEDLQFVATEHCIQAMKKHGINRFISLTGGGVRDEVKDEPKFMDKVIVFVMKYLGGKGTKYALLDGIRHAELIQSTDLDWTIVRGPMLTDDEPKGSYEVGYVGKISGFKLTREDLAAFILDTLENDKYVHDMPFLANKK